MARRRALALCTAALLPVALVSAPAMAQDRDDGPPPTDGEPTVVADGLNNPRQLNWSEDHQTLLVAEAGIGGTDDADCVTVPEFPNEPQCLGDTGAVTTIVRPWLDDPTVAQPVTGLPSLAGPNGAFASGHSGVDAVEAKFPGEFISARGALGDPETDTGQGLYYLVDTEGIELPDGEEAPDEEWLLPGGDLSIPLANSFRAESAENPGGGQVDSNAYALLFIDPTPNGAGAPPTEEPPVEPPTEEPPAEDPAVVKPPVVEPPTEEPPTEEPEDGYALLADAGANTVWRLVPDYENLTEEGIPAINVEVFYSWDDRAEGEEVAEFVPTSLAYDIHGGHVYVGGLGSEIPGAASVVQLDLDGNLIQQWDGFTGVTGVAVDDENLYVSELFSGQVLKTSRHATDAERFAVPAPFPAGLATDRGGNVYVAVNSIAPAEGVTEPLGPGSPEIEGGAVWRIDTDSITGTPAEPTEPPPGEEPPPVDPPTDPVDPPTDPVDPPTDPVDPPTDPVDPPTDPVDPPTDPVDPPTDPVDPPTDPVEPPVVDPVDVVEVDRDDILALIERLIELFQLDVTIVVPEEPVTTT